MPSRLSLFTLLAGALVAASAVAGGRHGDRLPSRCDDPLAVPTVDCGRAPGAVFDAAGRLWIAWARGGHVYVNHSDDEGGQFSIPVPVNRLPEAIAARGENRPRIAVDPAGRIHVSWTRTLPGPYAGDIRYSRSLDGGRSFVAPVTINDDRRMIGHRFGALATGRQGRVFLAWSDKRDRADAKARGQTYRGAALYFAESRDGGASFGPNRKIADHTCECCRVAMDLDPEGRPVIVWRQIYGRNVRDHALVRVPARGRPPPPTRVSHDEWAVDACPHHGPAVSVAADGTWHVAWFTDGKARHGLFHARSADRGRTFTEPASFGRYDAGAAHPDVLALGARVFLTWKEFDGTSTVLRIRASNDGGRSWDAARTLARTRGGSDHPFLISRGADAFVSWATDDDGYRLLPVSAAPQEAATGGG